MTGERRERDWVAIGERATAVGLVALVVAVVAAWFFFSSDAGKDVAASAQSATAGALEDDAVRKAFLLFLLPLLTLFQAGVFVVAIGWRPAGRRWFRAHVPWIAMVTTTFVSIGFMLRTASILLLAEEQQDLVIKALGVVAVMTVAYFIVEGRRWSRDRDAAVTWASTWLLFRVWMALCAVAAIAVWLAVLTDVPPLG